MSCHGINKRLFPSIFLLLMMTMYYSCVKSISESESENIEILNTSIALDRFENELFFQVETNQEESQELIQNVSVELAYIGDDLIDIPVMEKVGLPAAVQNAYPDVKEKAVFVTKTRGGEGAFREFIDWMLMELGTYKKCLEDMQINVVNNS